MGEIHINSKLNSSILIFGPALSDSLFVDVFNDLKKNGETSFYNLKKNINTNSNSLQRSLKKFKASGLIIHKKYETPKGRRYSFYQLSEFGEKIYSALLSIQDDFVPEGKIKLIAYDIFEQVEKTLYLDEKEICWKGSRKNSVEKCVTGVPHRKNEDCARFCHYGNC
jgi:DNA-binding HxlR family transcriptional regulator